MRRVLISLVDAGEDDLDDGAGDQDIKFGTRVMRHTR